jgi:hypothetical protein
LKNYFSTLSVGSSSNGSRPSTHESGNATTSTAGGVVQENEATQSVPTDVAQIDVGVDDNAQTPEPQQRPQPQEQGQQQEEDEGISLITQFDPHVHIVADPALRMPIERFHPSVQSDVRRAYLLRGPTQPIGLKFPRKRVGNDWRQFHEKWFKEHDWLEYSVSKDAAFCFYCYLFRQEADHEKFGHVVFTKTGFNDFKHAYRGFPGHVGGVSSCHNKARLCAEVFKNQRASITHKIDANTKTAEMLYEVRLTAALDVASFLIALDVGLIVTSTSASCKRKDRLQAQHHENIIAKLESGEILRGRGRNQMTNLHRPGDIRWGSHYITLLRIESMWDSVVKVLAMIHEDERNPGRAGGLVHKMESFDFVLNMRSNHFVLKKKFQYQIWKRQYQDGADQGVMAT